MKTSRFLETCRAAGLTGCVVAVAAGCCRGWGSAEPPPMPTVRAPFADRSVGAACARQKVVLAYDGARAAPGETIEFDRTMYRLRVRRHGEPFMMMWPNIPGGMQWGIYGTTNRISNALGADGAVTRTAPVFRKKGTAVFRQVIRPDGPGRCAIETDVRAPGAAKNEIAGLTVLWEDGNVWRFGSLTVTGEGGTKTFTGDGLVVRDPVRLCYATGAPDGTYAVEFPKGLFSVLRLQVAKNGVDATLSLAQDRVGGEVRFVYDFGERLVPAPPGPESVNGTDFREEGDLRYVCWDYAHNVLPNPSFESDGRYWTGGRIRTDLAHSGRRSMDVTSEARTFALPAAAGQTNVLSLWARSTDGKGHSLAVRHIHWSGIDPSVPLPRTKFLNVPAGSGWTRLEYAFLEPMAGTALAFGGRNVVIDDVQFECGARASAYTMPPWGFALENDGPDPYFADANRPIGARLVFRGPAGAKGAVDVKVVSFFEEETYAGSFPFALGAAGETRFAIPDSAFRIKGANAVVATVRPSGGVADARPFTDHLRLSVYAYADGTAKNRTFHQYSSVGGHDREQLQIPESYFRMMKTTGIAPRCRAIQDNVGVYPPETARAIVKRYADIGGMTFGYVVADSVRNKARPAQFFAKMAARGFPDPHKIETFPEGLPAAVEAVTEEIVAAAPWADVWIGPDEISSWWACLKGDDGTRAAQLLMAMHRGVKKANPKATFICYSTCDSGEVARTELRKFLAAAKKLDPGFRFDAVDPHPYRCFYETEDGVGDVDDDWAKIFKTLDDCGQGQCVCYCFGGGYAYPFYLPSWGGIAPWASVGQKDKYSSLGLSGYAMGWGERSAAAMQLRYNLAAYKHAPRLRTNTNWMPRSIDALNPHAPNVATAGQTELLGDASFYRDVRFAPGCRAYVFDDGHGRATAVFWKFSRDLDRGREKAGTLALDLNGLDAELFDMMANRRSAPKDADGRTILPLSGFPVYVRVPRDRADALAAAFARVR